jgi:hypothetical protein
MELVLDTFSLSLLALLVVLLVVHALFLRPSPSPLHPILLGRQSEVSKVRAQRESAVYGSSLNGGRMLQRRTASAVKDVGTLALTDGPWKKRAETLASGLKQVTGLGDSEKRAVVAVSIAEPEGLCHRLNTLRLKITELARTEALAVLLALSLLNVQVLLVPSTFSGSLANTPQVDGVIADPSRLPVLQSLVGFSTQVVITAPDSSLSEKATTLAQITAAATDDFKRHPFELDDVFLRYATQVDGEVRYC